MKKNLKHDLKVHRSELLLHNTLTVFIRTPVRMQIETQIDADKMTNMLWGISDNSRLTVKPLFYLWYNNLNFIRLFQREGKAVQTTNNNISSKNDSSCFT